MSGKPHEYIRKDADRAFYRKIQGILKQYGEEGVHTEEVRKALGLNTIRWSNVRIGISIYCPNVWEDEGRMGINKDIREEPCEEFCL